MLDPHPPRQPLSLLPSFASPSTSKSPHIRTPGATASTSHSSYFTTNFKAGMSPSTRCGRIRTPSLPKPVIRGLLAALAILGVFVLSRSAGFRGGGGGEEGVWDASSWSERRGGSPGQVQGVGLEAMRKKMGTWISDTDQEREYLAHAHEGLDIPPIPEEAVIPRPKPISRPKSRPIPPNNNSNHTASRDSIDIIHPGKSRRIIPKSNPEKYEYHPLPSLEEAFEFLHPLLRAVKEKTEAVPREHELTEPIFSPYMTHDLKERYRHLRDDWDEEKGEWIQGEERRWFLVTICRQVAGMLADWFAAWTVLADFLGPESLVFSLIEGDSADGSGQILSEVMRIHLLNIGVPPENIHIQTHLPGLDWETVHRIEKLAEMRNAGMQPFYDSLPKGGLSPDGHPWTAVVFYNDVYLSAQHFLELMHQHFKQEADMTCGWDHAGRWFYDGWVGRDMSGDLYTPFPVKEEDKDLPQKLFPSSPSTLRRYERMLPFQVFAGWNGITVLSPQPFMPPYNVRFRRAKPRTTLPDGTEEWECQASESAFISWDFWKYGFGRIAVIPGVHATYGKEDAMMRGWLEWPEEGDGLSEQIQWDDNPPGRIRCHDWPDKPGKGWWAWDTVRWVKPPKLVVPQ